MSLELAHLLIRLHVPEPSDSVRTKEEIATVDGTSRCEDGLLEALGQAANFLSRSCIPNTERMSRSKASRQDVSPVGKESDVLNFGGMAVEAAELLHTTYVPDPDRAVHVLRRFVTTWLRSASSRQSFLPVRREFDAPDRGRVARQVAQGASGFHVPQAQALVETARQTLGTVGGQSETGH